MNKYQTFLNTADDVIISLMDQGMSNSQILTTLLDEKSSGDPRMRKRLTALHLNVDV